MKAEQFFALKPNRNLIDGSFEGYKISFNSPSITSRKLSEDVRVKESSADCFCYLQTRLAALHNHLHSDPYNSGVVYYFGQDNCLRAVPVSANDDSVLVDPDEVVVYSWAPPAEPDGATVASGGRQYQQSLVFASESVAVLADGAGVMAVVLTEHRSHPSQWQTVYRSDSNSSSSSHSYSVGNLGFVLLAAVASDCLSPRDEQSSWQLDLLTCHVAGGDASASGGNSVNHLTHLTFSVECGGRSWRCLSSTRLWAPGALLYSALLPPDTTAHPGPSDRPLPAATGDSCDAHGASCGDCCLLLVTDRAVSFSGGGDDPAIPANSHSTTPSAQSVEEPAHNNNNSSASHALSSLYIWSQTDSEVSVLVRVPTQSAAAAGDGDNEAGDDDNQAGGDSCCWRVLLSPAAVTVLSAAAGGGSCRELLRLQLAGSVETADSCSSSCGSGDTWWSRLDSDDGVLLKMRLTKREPGVVWPSLTAAAATGAWVTAAVAGGGGQLGHELPASDIEPLAACITACLQQLTPSATTTTTTNSNNNSGEHSSSATATATDSVNVSVSADCLEDCDSVPDDTCLLLRINTATQVVTHQCSLGAHQYVMTATLSAHLPPALCLRHDVDALLWQPTVSGDNKFQCEHVGTLNAFGYVQASKTQRKFSLCAPDMSYAAVCDASRHIYVYKQPEPLEGELKNRSTGRRVSQISRLHVLNLDDQEPILGAVAFHHYLLILTSKYIHCAVLR